MRALFLAMPLVALGAPGALAGFTEQMQVEQELGYAQAAVVACPTIKMNSGGVLTVMKTLNADDQASVATGKTMIDYMQPQSATLFALLGPGSCDAALDYEKKLGVDIFVAK